MTTRASQLHTTLSRLLATMESEIPSFAHPPGGGRGTSNLVRHASVPPKFVSAAIHGARDVPSLRAIAVFDPEDAKAAQQRIHDLEMFESDVERFLRGLRFTIQREKARLGSLALRLYSVAQAFRNDPQRNDIVGQLDHMRELLHKRTKQRAQNRRRRLLRQKTKA